MLPDRIDQNIFPEDVFVVDGFPDFGLAGLRLAGDGMRQLAAHHGIVDRDRP